MLTPFALFFGLTIATAVIAYWSDNLGKKLGKKRVSLFGLRPRTTATVLTVASSWGIMLFTLVTLLATFEPLRSALFYFDQQRLLFRQQLKENKEQISINKELTAETSDLKTKAEQAQKARREAEGQAQAAQTRTRDAQKGEAAARKAEGLAQSREQKARQGEQAARRGQEAARSGQREAEAQTKTALLRTAAAQRDLQRAKGRLTKTESNLAAAQNRLSTAQQRLTATQQRLTQAQQRLRVAQQKVKAAEEKSRYASLQAVKAYREAVSAYREAGLAQQAKDKALQDLEVAKAAVNKLYIEFQQLAPLSNGDIRVRFEQTFAARLIQPDQPEAAIESQVRAVLQDARTAAPNLISGAKVLLVNRITSDDQFIDISEDQYIKQLVNYILLQHEPVSVRVSSLRNYTEDEKDLVARFVVVPVRRAFNEGDILGEITIDGGASEARIFNALFTRLIEIGRQNATMKGVNPPQSPEEPNFYATGTNEALFDALSKIKNAGTTVSVRLVAAQDLSTAQPLKVRFEIVPGVPS